MHMIVSCIKSLAGTFNLFPIKAMYSRCQSVSYCTPLTYSRDRRLFVSKKRMSRLCTQSLQFMQLFIAKQPTILLALSQRTLKHHYSKKQVSPADHSTACYRGAPVRRTTAALTRLYTADDYTGCDTGGTFRRKWRPITNAKPR
jgi:hypothetical protein